jgi:hypothetical protein
MRTVTQCQGISGTITKSFRVSIRRIMFVGGLIRENRQSGRRGGGIDVYSNLFAFFRWISGEFVGTYVRSMAYDRKSGRTGVLLRIWALDSVSGRNRRIREEIRQRKGMHIRGVYIILAELGFCPAALLGPVFFRLPARYFLGSDARQNPGRLLRVNRR